MVVAGIGNRKIQYQLSAMTSKSENDFTYKDRYRYQTPAIKNNHNAYRDYGIVQNIYINLNKGNFLEAGVWYQKKMLEIPALMGSLKPGTARQKDSLFRSFIGFNRKTDHSIFSFKSAYFSDQLNYTDRTNPTDSGYSLDSKIATNRFINDVTIRYYFSKKIIGGAGMSFNRINGNSNNYGGKIHENEFALYGNVKAIFKNLIINAGIRKEYYEGINARPQYSAGIRFMADSRLVFRSSFSTKFRKPTFNEKYWRPGGNPDLRPEKGHGGDFTIEWNTIGNKNSLFWLDTRISCFYQTVDNWIQWVLTDSLTPVEYKKVHTGGVESWVEFEFHTGLLKVNGQINYNYNRAEIVNTFDDNELYEGKQLIYTPKNTLRANSEAHYQGFMLGFAVSYSGKRETVETGDPSLQLPAFTLWDLSAGIQKKFKQTTLSLYFQVDNIFNKSYEIIRSYPLPGRTYQLTLSVGLHKSGSEN
jgi:outer membrane cobalamin receptor